MPPETPSAPRDPVPQSAPVPPAAHGRTDSVDIQITIVMPCLNEAETLEGCIREAWRGIEAAGLPGEIVIADNGSTDGSPAIAERLGARVIHVPQKGYGSALRAGMEAARGRYIIMGDSDGSYDFSETPNFVTKLQAGAGLVMGCRLPSGGGTILPGAMPWKHRWIGNPALTGIGRLLFRAPCHDFHCGLRALTKDAFQKMELRTTGMEFASEMVIKACLRGIPIEEIPITLRKDGRSRPPHLRSWRDGWRHLRFMLLFSPRWLLLYPGLALMLVSAALFLRLLAGPLQIGSVSFDLNTLDVTSLGLLFGYQMVLLACFARIFAHTRGFLPRQHWLEKAFRYFTLERGLLAGAAALLAGLGVIGFTLWNWALLDFGALHPQIQTRWVMAGRTLAALGAQTILFSLIFSYLGLDDSSRSANNDR